MEVTQTDGEGKSEVTVSGDLDMQSSPELRKVLTDLVRKKATHIIINLEAVPYIDSSGLATLVECMQGTNRTKARLQLIGVNERIWPVFELARLHEVCEIRRDTTVE